MLENRETKQSEVHHKKTWDSLQLTFFDNDGINKTKKHWNWNQLKSNYVKNYGGLTPKFEREL